MTFDNIIIPIEPPPTLDWWNKKGPATGEPKPKPPKEDKN